MNVRTKVSVQFPREKIVTALRTAAASGLNAGGTHFAAQTVSKLASSASFGNSKPGGYPANSKGTLKSSVRMFQSAKPDSLSARVGSSGLNGKSVPQAFYTQFGAKAKGKMLTVPVSKKGRDGMIQYGSIRVLARVERLTFITSRHKIGTFGVWGKVIGSAKRKNQRFEPWVALKKEVKARPWLTLSYRDHKAGTIDAIRTQYQLRWATESRKVFAQLGKAKK